MKEYSPGDRVRFTEDLTPILEQQNASRDRFIAAVRPSLGAFIENFVDAPQDPSEEFLRQKTEAAKGVLLNFIPAVKDSTGFDLSQFGYSGEEISKQKLVGLKIMASHLEVTLEERRRDLKAETDFLPEEKHAVMFDNYGTEDLYAAAVVIINEFKEALEEQET